MHEVFWEVERYRPSPELAPIFPNRPQRYIPRGAAVRRIDHVTFNTDDPLRDAHWYRDVLGYRFTELIRFDHAPNVVLGAFVSTTPMSHDLGLIRDALDRSGKLSGIPGRTNHIAFWLDQREDVLRACEVYRENGVELEFGPGAPRRRARTSSPTCANRAACAVSCSPMDISSTHRMCFRSSGGFRKAR